MFDMHELRVKLCEELEEITRQGDMSMGDLDTIHKLTDTIKNIDKIEMLEGSNSYGGEWEANGNYSRNGSSYTGYGNGNSYGRNYSGARHYVRGHYSRGAEGSEMLMDHIEQMINDNRINDSEKSTLRKAMDILRR